MNNYLQRARRPKRYKTFRQTHIRIRSDIIEQIKPTFNINNHITIAHLPTKA